MMLKKYCLTAAMLFCIAAGSFASEWTVKDDVNTVEDAKLTPPGRKVDVALDGKLVARFIYGEGQFKPYLHVYGEDGDCLTQWDPKQTFPHHRGIFIGWNKIGSDLGGSVKKGTTTIDPKGTFDLWHFNNGGKMEVLKFEKLEGGKDNATLVATIAWRAGNKDASGSDLLMTETRTIVISRPSAKKTQVDASFELTAARDVSLNGDLQHAGVHFRSTAELQLQKRTAETSYVWEPSVESKGGKASSAEFKWARLQLPVGKNWYSVTHMNASTNPVEELSTRDYGRFGFFFKKDLKKAEVMKLKYRIVTEQIENGVAKPSAEQNAAARTSTQAEYDAFAKTITK
ncbi:MAG: DUF6807 family protein [Planctomycetota bacterium]